MRPKILIMGFGHLARFIVQEKTDLNYLATYRQAHKITDHLHSSIKFIHYEIAQTKLDSALLNWQADWVIWNFPPVVDYLDSLKQFDQLQSTETKWVFISSTSVYADGIIDEKSLKCAKTPNAQRLIEIEDWFTQLKRAVTILRPGGLIDHLRHPVYSLVKKVQVEGAQSPVNLVHTQDVAKAVFHVIEHELINDDFNLVSDQHPSKQEYYSTIAQQLKLSTPNFLNQNSLTKIVSAQKFMQTGFNFKDIYQLDS
jgi:hypothetical protein